MLWLLFLVSFVTAQNIFAPEVFSADFYINTNPDLIAAGILTLQAAEEHWQDHGINEGRQACGSFHTQQYLLRYPDVRNFCKGAFACALDHYLQFGLNEGRLGYAEGGAFGRWTVSSQNNRGLFASGSTRMAGAIDSVVWNSFEFVNQWDHGRELQIALTNGNGECYNPTEAGSSDDGTTASTTSLLQSINASGTVLQTTSLPAFWLAPGQREPNPSPACTVAINKQKLSNFQITKKVVIVSPNHLRYNFSITISDPCPQLVQIEGPTQYLPIDFSQFFTIDKSTGQLTPISQAPGEVPQPLVFSTPDKQFAVGCYGNARGAWKLTYAKFFFPNQGAMSANTAKWSIVYRLYQSVPAGTVFSFSSDVCIGSLSQVVVCMKNL